jgi:hypothetical protein
MNSRDFQSGVKVQIGGQWGEGVVWNAPPYEIGNNSLEYQFSVECAGRYRLTVEYASAQNRGVSLYVNEKFVSTALGKNTGGFDPSAQRWNDEGVITLTKGQNSLRFATGPQQFLPHIRKLKLEPVK